MGALLKIGDLALIKDYDEYEDCDEGCVRLGTLLSFSPFRERNNSLNFLWEVLIESEIHYVPEHMIMPI